MIFLTLFYFGLFRYSTHKEKRIIEFELADESLNHFFPPEHIGIISSNLRFRKGWIDEKIRRLYFRTAIRLAFSKMKSKNSSGYYKLYYENEILKHRKLISMKLKIGIFGGTFDPIHIGHLITCRHVLEQRKLGRIVFIPCHISPHKQDQIASPPLHRLNMVRLAIEGIPEFEVSDIELVKGDVSYSVDTINELKKSYAHIELIIGYDNLVVFDKWHMPERIVEMAQLVVMKRITDKETVQKNRFFEKAVILNSPTIEVSSTEIRERVKTGRPIDFLVPDKVKEYIYKNGLYR
jgi:nicotinate-nucleotide adenylyltransferase